jgi:hypothetical protein
MKTCLIACVAAVALTGHAAAEPVRLTSTDMDRVTAAFDSAGSASAEAFAFGSNTYGDVDVASYAADFGYASAAHSNASSTALGDMSALSGARSAAQSSNGTLGTAIETEARSEGLVNGRTQARTRGLSAASPTASASVGLASTISGASARESATTSSRAQASGGNYTRYRNSSSSVFDGRTTYQQSLTTITTRSIW